MFNIFVFQNKWNSTTIYLCFINSTNEVEYSCWGTSKAVWHAALTCTKNSPTSVWNCFWEIPLKLCKSASRRRTGVRLHGFDEWTRMYRRKKTKSRRQKILFWVEMVIKYASTKAFMIASFVKPLVSLYLWNSKYVNLYQHLKTRTLQVYASHYSSFSTCEAEDTHWF